MSIDRAREYLKKYNKDKEIREYEHSTYTVADAAEAINVEEGMIAKTMSIRMKEKVILVVCAGDLKIDNSKFKQEFGERPHMLAFDDVEPIIGHMVGGVCPFGINDGIEVYIDISLNKYEYVYPACGSINSCIKLTPKELFEISSSIRFVDVCK